MATDRVMAERGNIEIKMGKSKFPGKPSKIGNRKRVNLSSCALPEDNDSSKAAKNIYLGLSVFNETFGDNEMVAPIPFHGFSLMEVEEAVAEARLQQKEAEVEYNKQGININLWDIFQSELFAIASCSSGINDDVSFDGGGHCQDKGNEKYSSDSSDIWPSEVGFSGENSHKLNTTSFITHRVRNTSQTPTKKVRQFHLNSPKLKLGKISPNCNKSLQTQAAKKLLEKAKMSNLNEGIKNCSVERKLFPNLGTNSPKFIRPNKRCQENNPIKRKSRQNFSNFKYNKKSNISYPACVPNGTDKKLGDGFNVSLCSQTDGTKNKQSSKIEENPNNKVNESKNLLDNLKSTIPTSSSGKIILRKARLQLDKSNTSILEGPFSSSLSQLSAYKKVSAVQSPMPANTVCGICGIFSFHKFVELSKKFGINCCESCEKFISQIIKSVEFKEDFKVQCLRGDGFCRESAYVKDSHLTKNFKCQACWLKLCVKNLNFPVELKQNLLKVLPVNIQKSINLEFSTITNKTNNDFRINNMAVQDFKCGKQKHTILSLHSECTSVPFNNPHLSKVRLSGSNNNETKCTEFHTLKSNSSDTSVVNGKSLRKRTRNYESDRTNLLNHNEKHKTQFNEKNRRLILLRGPRVKHVCRSASVALGQPLAIFPNERSPTKKQNTESAESCKDCETTLTKKNSNGTEEISNKQNLSGEIKLVREKKIDKCKDLDSKTSNAVDEALLGKSKKKVSTKVENPVSMDFWESYDPEEICETGFGLIGSEHFSVRALCFLCGSSGQEKLIHCASCCEPYHEFCIDGGQTKSDYGSWKYDWICPRCTVCFTCGKTSGQQLKCVKCDNSYHTECVDRVGGRLLHSPDRPWVCSTCLRCKSCNVVDVSIFVGNLPLCKSCFILRQKGNYCPLCQRCYEDDDYDSKMMECGQCKCWVHAKCEGLSDEKYQVLSFLPESVEYVCRMCCVMPPAPWWLAVEAELKSGYLGVLKALSKNRKACTMLKWSPRKQCTCRNIEFVSRALDFDDTAKTNDCISVKPVKEDGSFSVKNYIEKGKEGKSTARLERKTSIEVINHPTKSLKLTLKITKDTESSEKFELSDKIEDSKALTNENNVSNCVNENSIRVKKCPSSEEKSGNVPKNAEEFSEDGQTSFQPTLKENSKCLGFAESIDKRSSSSSPLTPPSDSGIGSADEYLKVSLTDEESGKQEEQRFGFNQVNDSDVSVSLASEKLDCFCFLEVDSYNSRSKPFSPNLMSIKKKVTTSEYSSLHQFHQDMERMIATSNSTELMDLYHQTIKEIFPWFDPKFSRVQSSSQKVSGSASVDSTPVKSTPPKNNSYEECIIPKDKLFGQPLDYFYSNYVLEDKRICLLCKTCGDGPPGGTGRLLYCGQNEWVHCNCALWSGEVFEEIDGSLQNVHSAINRGRSIRCPECNLKGASIGCCARNCQETYHFICARKAGCTFMDDKTMYCSAHAKDCSGKLTQNEKEFEIRRPVYVELDKRKMKSADSTQIHFAVGSLQVNSLGRFIVKLSDHSDAIIPDQFSCTRWFWSCYEPWRLVRYNFTVRLAEAELSEGVDVGINLTVDHSKDPEFVELKLKQLKYFLEFNTFLDINEKILESKIKEKRKFSEANSMNVNELAKNRTDDVIKVIPTKRYKKDSKDSKKIFEQFDCKEDENCLSDNQSTADLLPPDLEEAIFKDLPHDILDGISMQDIFLDIKNDTFDNNSKDGLTDDILDGEENLEIFSIKSKKNDSILAATSQNEYWNDVNESSRQETDDILLPSKFSRDFRKCKSDVLPYQLNKKNSTLKTYQKSCSINRNCKLEGANSKWKKNSKCFVTVNLLEHQERGTMLQELKFTDGLVTVSTGTIGTMKDFKSRIEDNKRSIQEEGKENKCLTLQKSWQTNLQPRLLQVDGGADLSSSGSEAGESPQRLNDENINSKLVALPQSSPFLDLPVYAMNSPQYKGDSSPLGNSSLIPEFFNAANGTDDCPLVSDTLPQIDGAWDSSDSEEIFVERYNIPKLLKWKTCQKSSESFGYKINQCDGGIDSDCDDDDDDSLKLDDRFNLPLSIEPTEEKPVKCKKCHCTYRTHMSYQRHLESCNNEFMLSSSEGEISEEDSPKKEHSNNSILSQFSNSNKNENTLSQEIKKDAPVSVASAPFKNNETSSDFTEHLEVKKEKSCKKTYSRKKTDSSLRNNAAGTQKLPKIAVQQCNATPTLIVQDMPAPNIAPATFIGPAPSLGYVTPMATQNEFKNSFIAQQNGFFPGGVIPGSENQLLGGLFINSQNVQPNVPGFIIQQSQPPPQPPGSYITPQQGPILITNEQLMMGSTNMLNIIQDPGTGSMFLASNNQPFFYNMETVVSNTVMQTNQFVSNVLATTYSQTSTQIFQAGEMDRVLNVPSNYILVGPSPPTSEDLICVQTPATLIHNQAPIQIQNTPLQPNQAFCAEPKLISAQISSVPFIQPVYPSFVLNKVNNTNTNVIVNQTVQAVNQPPVCQKPNQSIVPSPMTPEVNAKPPVKIKAKSNVPRSFPMMRPSVTISPDKTFEKALVTPKSKIQNIQPRSRALVEYINNFRSDNCESCPVKANTHETNKRNCTSVKESRAFTSPKLLNAPSVKQRSQSTISSNGLESSTILQNSSPSEIRNVSTPCLATKDISMTFQENCGTPRLPIAISNDQSKTQKIRKVSPPILESQNNLATPTIVQNTCSASMDSSSPKTTPCRISDEDRVVTNTAMLSAPRISPPKNMSMPLLESCKSPLSGDLPTLCVHHPAEMSATVYNSSMNFESDKPDQTENTFECHVQTESTEPPKSQESPIPLGVLTNKTNSIQNEPEIQHHLKTSISETSPVPCHEDKLKYSNEFRENNKMSETLHLQENRATINVECRNKIKSPSNCVSKNSPPVGEKAKCKRKVISVDQNSLEFSSLNIKGLNTPMDSESKPFPEKLSLSKSSKDNGPKLIFDVVSDDGFKSSSTSMAELWANICDSVQEMRASLKIPPLPISRKGHEVLGMQNHGLQHCLEQLRGVEQCVKYKCKYFLKEDVQKDEEDEVKENLTGCARTEKFTKRKEYDMFAWLASKHRQLPRLLESAEENLFSIRRANNLPMAMRYRNLRETAKLYVGVYRSKIHGRGLFCLREIEAGEMVIEYAGEVIRANLTDKREKYYTEKGIGCYMFRIDDHFVVDATMKGNAARFINHSCEPNCYSRVVDILGKKHIVIFALRRINIMEELTYDYKFPFEDEKISCHCLSKKCRKYLN